MSEDSTSVIAYIGLAVSIGTAVLGVINHKRIRSSCCGKKVDVSFDVENTTPPKLKDPPPEAKAPELPGSVGLHA